MFQHENLKYIWYYFSFYLLFRLIRAIFYANEETQLLLLRSIIISY